MIISHKYKFIYLKGHKVAGSSVLLALGRYCGEADSVYLPAKGNPPEDVWQDADWTSSRNLIGLQRESTPNNVRNKIGDNLWNEYTKLTIVRNPWDMMVSSFFWHKRHQDLKNVNLKADFNDWIKTNEPLNKLKKNISLAIDTEGNRILDYYIRFESLQQSYMQFCEKVGIESIDLPRLKSNVRKLRNNETYESFYTNASRNLVHEHSNLYIKEFGYEFGE